MQTKVVDFSKLNYELASSFAIALRNNNFAIVAASPTETNYPEGLYDIFIKRETYCTILEDEDAVCTYYFIRFKIADDYYGDIPIGVFGTSHAKKINYPFFGNSVLRRFLDINKSDFSAFVEVNDDNELDEIFSRLLAIRIAVIKKIFTFYGHYNNYNSIMSWTIRHKESITRRVAESIPYHRTENSNKNLEYYGFKELNETETDYFKACYTAWEKLGADSSKLTGTPKFKDDSDFDLTMFYKELVTIDNVKH